MEQVVRSPARPLSGMVALVTNADQGIGMATAYLLAQNGAHLALTLDAAAASGFLESLRSFGTLVTTHPPVAVQDNVRSAHLVRSVVAAHGKLDVVVANEERRLQWQVDDADLDEDALDEQYAVNVKGAICLIRAAVNVMQDGGRVVALGASIADRVGTPGLAHYAATRAAIAAFCRGAAHDLGPSAITINVVQAGAIDTDPALSEPEFASAEKEATALKRLGKPEEVAHAILFLAGPGASFITGSVINVDGGYNA